MQREYVIMDAVGWTMMKHKIVVICGRFDIQNFHGSALCSTSIQTSLEFLSLIFYAYYASWGVAKNLEV